MRYNIGIIASGSFTNTVNYDFDNKKVISTPKVLWCTYK